MKQEIHFRGLSLTPDNHHAPQGALSVCSNAELHDGALRPSVLEGTPVTNKLLHSSNAATLVFVHKFSNNTFFIATEGGNIHWFTANGSYGGQIMSASNLKEISAVGKTLIIVFTTGIHYAVRTDTTYAYLGTRPPFPQIRFTAKSQGFLHTDVEIECSEDIYHLDTTHGGTAYYIFNEDIRVEFTEKVMAEINKAIDEGITSLGYFYAPMLIRYCYRLFDGSCIWHSSPIMMHSLLEHPVIARADFPEGYAGTDKIILKAHIAKYQIRWECVNHSAMANIGRWADIVKSVDVFVTPQFSRIDTAETVKGFIPGNRDYSDALYDNTALLVDDAYTDYYSYEYDHFNPIPSGQIAPRPYIILPEQGDDSFFTRIKNASNFYRIASLSLSSLAESASHDISAGQEVIRAVATQEKMEDDYRSHYLYKSSTTALSNTYVYNGRLHLFDAVETLGFQQPFVQFFPYMTSASSSTQSLTMIAITCVRVVLKTENGTKVIQLPDLSSQSICLQYLSRAYIFFPDSRADAIEIQYSGSNTFPVFKLEPHPLLEGAYCFMQTPTRYNSMSGVATDVPFGNRILVSEFNNPYYFPLEARQTVGIGSIIGMAANTRALSPGQYGVHPLMAFCTDGIWTLDVNKQGTYSNAHNVSREVCTNQKSICQLDQAVLFATKHGLNRIVESDVESVSAALEGPLFSVTTLTGSASTEPVDPAAIGTHPITWLQTSQLIYDATNARVLCLAANSDKAYVLSLKDWAWSTMDIGINNARAAVNSYPFPYIQESDGTVLQLDMSLSAATAGGSRTTALIVTRSLAWAATMQVIQAFQQLHNIANGQNADNTPTLYLYGSNDDITWKTFGSVKRSHASYLPGHPFRFFRIAVTLSMLPTEKYYSLILDVVEKYQKL